MHGPQDTDQRKYDWTPQAEAAEYVQGLIDGFVSSHLPTAVLRRRLSVETGTRLNDWIDHFVLPPDVASDDQLISHGFRSSTCGDAAVWRHADGLFPAVARQDDGIRRLAIRVDSVVDFLAAQSLDDRTVIEGRAGSPLRKALVAGDGDHELWVVERHGRAGWEPVGGQTDAAAGSHHSEAFRLRRREFDDPAAGFDHALHLIRAAGNDLGVDWTCDLFFAAERSYWQSRNRAARIQKARQDALGLGWANHDHHTYRSSREYFAQLIAVLETLGCQCRERFYAGAEAGWGAQVLENPAAGIVIFADVDLAPNEVTGDFARQGLTAADRLGTVGLWCRLHGEAFLQAGMHHLECQFDFDAARTQLASAGARAMPPFTDLPYLKQAFTEGEMWPVAASRIERALADGVIDVAQAERFASEGALGSHLEILQRNDGYKGFNQTGISDIIRKTDPRR